MDHTLSPLKGFTPSDLSHLVHTHFGIEGNISLLPGELDINALLTSTTGEKYMLKIAHKAADQDNIEMQNALMQHLEQKALDLDLPKVQEATNGASWVLVKDSEGEDRLLRLLSFVEGDLWAKVNPQSADLLHSLGQAVGKVCKGLLDFDHPAAHRQFKWNLSDGLWIKDQQELITDEEQKAMLLYVINMVEEEVNPRKAKVRKSVIYNDANDYNIIVNRKLASRKVQGLIDFGDAVYSETVNDIAIAAAYACMGKADPLTAAAQLVQGFNEEVPLQEEELAMIFPLLLLRLAVSVTNSAHNRKAEPENTYLLISEKPAWDLLDKLTRISPQLAYYTFRHYCGQEACSKRLAFDQWLTEQKNSFGKVVDADWDNEATVFDLSIGSLDLGNNANFDTIPAFEEVIEQYLKTEKAQIGIGGYGEVRPFYSTDAYLQMGNNGPRWRTVHLGLDIWMPAESLVFAPLDGIVHSIQNNRGKRDYGPTVILEHKVSEALTFYTLYGHLSQRSLIHLYPGQEIEKGEIIATIGHSRENGSWPPHLHFQVILDLMGWRGDFPGVAYPAERDIWLSLCPNPADLVGGIPAIHPQVGTSSKDILEARQANLGKSLSVSYQEPLHIQRGYLQYLYDTNGRRFLDTVNNVAHVGHQHPRVVRAAQKQLGVLNTNTRYLHDNIVQYAEELLATFPPELSVCYFVNSGSEANELAIRMAKTYSGQQDMIAMEAGYHGNTGACVDLSSYKFDGKGGQGAPATTHVAKMPDTYRGEFKGKDAGQQYAKHIQELISSVQAKEKSIAGFICESILSCGGQIVLPNGFLPTAYSAVRSAGGLCIADEVQVGFGRVGEHFWGFELQGVIPDIVTMGKPIGNGHPLAAVVTTPAVAEAFTNGMEYFNTFGGNPVSCAIGRTVLQIVQEEDLQAHAQTVGQHLLAGLRSLQQQFPIIGDVRGHGLFLGFELVQDEQLTPAASQASYLANRMRQGAVLMSTDGPLHNVLKIKPPMCFTKTNADFFLEQLEQVFREDFMKVGN
ncbi:MAG: aminotransferase class III-fold pyridoxal phosphate-dependent enzyme [Saprospiraceae bacterium]|nr:aminotransferase class III-fold pyridoxal phosphate-dependent enzyme [Saprospiraceae bacterium]